MAAVRHCTARCTERKLTWAWLARHGMNAAIRLLGGRDCWMGGWAQHTGCSLRIVTERAAEVDPVHQLADDTIESSRDTLNMTCCTAGVRRWHTLTHTRMVGRVTAGSCVGVAACASITSRLCTGQHQGDTIASPRWCQKVENCKACHGSPVARLDAAPADPRTAGAMRS